MNVSERFKALLDNLKLTDEQKADGETKHRGVRNCLNQHYYGLDSDYANSTLVGSWGKETRIRPPRDIDVLFRLPDSVYHRFHARTGNKQSQLLQEVKSVLARRYPRTDIRGDGPVVLIPFATYSVELVPDFKLTNGKCWIPITKSGGSYKCFDPDAEIAAVRFSDSASSGDTRSLVRMMKRWQEHCTVPAKSFWLELLSIEFLATWQHRGKGTMYYDWMTRDFLKWLAGRVNGYVIVPGTFEPLSLGDAWKSRAETARDRAIKACEYEQGNRGNLAGEEWQKIFGTYIPVG